MEETIAERASGTVLQALREEPTSQPVTDEAAVAAAAKLILDIQEGQSLLEDFPGVAKLDATVVQELATAIDSNQPTLPREVLRKNAGILPRRLEALCQELRSMPNLGPLLPVNPETASDTNPEFYNHLEAVIEITERILTRNQSASQYRYFAMLANRWIRSYTLNFIIKLAIEYEEKQAAQQGRNAKSTNAVIQETIDKIEEIVRFRLVRTLRAFNDVLEQVLIERDDLHAIRGFQPLHLYLELGTAKKRVLQLIGMGLTRGAAIELNRYLSIESEASPDVFIDALRHHAQHNTKISKPVRKEVLSLVGTPQA